MTQRLPRVSAGRALVAAVAFLAALLGPATAWAGPLNPASPEARLQADLFWLVIGVAFIVLVAVEGLLIYTAVRFRRPDQAELPEPNQVHGNTRLEIMWAVFPALILVSLLALSVQSMSVLSALPEGARTIQAFGQQASWEFDYPGSSAKSMNDLRVPVGQPVVLEVTSRDIAHRFWVPELFGQVEAKPGVTGRTSFTAEQAGLYRGLCSGLCGEGSDDLLFNVTAMEAPEFETWLKEGGQAAAAPAAPAGNVALGKQLVVDKGCAACHTIDGVAGMTGTIGPNLSKVGTTAAARKPGMSAKDYITESITQPTAFTVPGFPAGVMPQIPITDEERDALVAHLLSLK